MWIREMRVLGIVGMRAAGHLRPGSAQARITEGFEADLGGVVADDRVVAKELEEFAAAFGVRRKFGFVGEVFEKSSLLSGSAVEEDLLVFGFAVRIEPAEAAGESDLGGGATAKRFFDGARVIVMGHRDAIGEHEVDEFGDTSLFGAGCIVSGNDHFGEVLDQAELIGGEEERLVGRGWMLSERGLRIAVRAGESPLPEAGKGRSHGSDANVAEDAATFDALASHREPSFCGESEETRRGLHHEEEVSNRKRFRPVLSLRSSV